MPKKYCRKCGHKLEPLGYMIQGIMYCDNEYCLLYGILTLVGVVEGAIINEIQTEEVKTV